MRCFGCDLDKPVIIRFQCMYKTKTLQLLHNHTINFLHICCQVRALLLLTGLFSIGQNTLQHVYWLLANDFFTFYKFQHTKIAWAMESVILSLKYIKSQHPSANARTTHYCHCISIIGEINTTV